MQANIIPLRAHDQSDLTSIIDLRFDEGGCCPIFSYRHRPLVALISIFHIREQINSLGASSYIQSLRQVVYEYWSAQVRQHTFIFQSNRGCRLDHP